MCPDHYRVTLQPSGLSYRVSPDQDLLTAAAAAGIAVPAACRNGVCEICEARLVAGQAVNTRNQQEVVPGARLMMCRSLALASLELEIPAVMAPGQNPPKTFDAKVVAIEAISHDVYRVELSLPRRRDLTFHAGQYLAVLLPGCEPSYFSIASSPLAAHIELHIQASPNWESAQRVIDTLKSADSIKLELPHGKACLAAAPGRPVIMVAAGTGFAQMKGMVDFLRETNSEQPVTLFWGVRRQEDMYLRALAEQWQQQWPGFRFVPVVGDDEDNDWSGHHEQLVHEVLASGAEWARVEVHASGSPTMVYTLMDALLEAGLPEDAYFSDVLEYAPRG